MNRGVPLDLVGSNGVASAGNNKARTLMKIVRTYFMPLSQSIMSLEEALVVWDSILAEDETNLGCQNLAGCDKRAMT